MLNNREANNHQYLTFSTETPKFAEVQTMSPHLLLLIHHRLLWNKATTKKLPESPAVQTCKCVPTQGMLAAASGTCGSSLPSPLPVHVHREVWSSLICEALPAEGRQTLLVAVTLAQKGSQKHCSSHINLSRNFQISTTGLLVNIDNFVLVSKQVLNGKITNSCAL